MKKLAAATLGAALAVTLGAGAALADPATGTWQTQVDDGSFAYVDMHECGSNVCGTISRTFDENGEYQSPNIGRQIVIDMTPQGGGAYEGQVWRPSNDKVYMGKMQLNGERLELKGCVAGGLFCASQTWARIQ